MVAISKILPTSHRLTVSSSFGPVELVPGTIWAGRKMLFYAAPLYVWYAVDDRAYEVGTGTFIRDEWLSAYARGVATATPWVTIAKVQFALLCGIFVPWYLMLGLSAAKAGMLYAANQDKVSLAMDKGPRLLGALKDLRSKNPIVFDKLLARIGREIFNNLPSGVTAQDVAFLIGRVIRGCAAEGPELTIRAFLKIVLTVTALVGATHLPAIAAHATAHVAEKNAELLRSELAANGYDITSEEAKAILREAGASPGTKKRLEDLAAAAKELQPVLESLAESYGGPR
jgi:hypothetical protein